MNPYLYPLVAFCAATALAQEVNAVLRQDINELLAQSTAQHIAETERGFGDAFDTRAFLRQLDAALKAAESLQSKEEPTVSERMVLSMLADFESRDVDRAALTARIRELLDNRKALKSMREMAKLHEHVSAAMQPVLRQRERSKEEAVLAANAKREGVKVLSNGVQMEVLPGHDSLRDINRITVETGIAFYSSTTRKTVFDELPKDLRDIADEVPNGGAWIFWIPASIGEARTAAAADEEAKRRETLQSIFVTVEDTLQAEGRWHEEEEEEPAVEPLRKVTVWKDGPDAPVQAQPDVMKSSL